ncbi:MAG: PD-(D/E)XK nuclease family protein [Acidobacteriota bacterium]
MWRLRIGLTQGYEVPVEGSLGWRRVTGGPLELLRWLETQLGLPPPASSSSHRVTQYAQALERKKAGASYEASFDSDRWTTAESLLRRRDELLLSGWSGAPLERAPAIISDLARVEQAAVVLSPGLPERLKLVQYALTNGQVLPPHECLLLDPLHAWPGAWKAVLGRLNIRCPEVAQPSAPAGSSLGKVQRQTLSGQTEPVRPDDSLRWLVCRSRLTACDLVSQLLAGRGLPLSDVVILCEDESTAILLDGCLANAGLPTTGAASRDPFHPVLQVVSLALRLLWEPVDPQVLLDFLCLPVGPVPKRAAQELAWALVEQPGFQSDAWKETVSRLCRPENDPDGSTRARLSEWFDVKRCQWGQPLPAGAVEDCCRRISAWSAAYCKAIETTGGPEKRVVFQPLIALAEYASFVRELVLTQGETVSEPQLARILQAAQNRALGATPHCAMAFGPRLVSGLQEVTAPCRHLIWLGLGTSESAPGLWRQSELQSLADLGIPIDDGSARLECLRQAERRGFCLVSESLLAIQVSTDEEKRTHPVWLQVQEAFAAADIREPTSLAQWLSEPGELSSAHWSPRREVFRRIPAPEPILSSEVDPLYLKDRETSSATELIDRLGCPNKWVLRNLAELRHRAIASLPSGDRLKGTFCHDVFRSVFAGLGSRPGAEEALRLVARAFDEAVSRNAALLALPSALAERNALRNELLNSTRVLIEALAAGGYRITAMETNVEGHVAGRPLSCRIDCLAVSDHGEELILDFKYGSANTYRELLRNGRAVQLATYAAARGSQRAGRFPAVGYLVLSTGTLLTPEGSPIRGAGPAEIVRQAPSVREVWARFAAALDRADGWLRGEAPVPSRPMLEFSEWPEGTELVLDGPNRKGVMPDPATQYVCRYCDYPVLCGLRRLF